MDPDATLPPPAELLANLPTVGYENGEPPREPPVANGLADDGDSPEVPGYEVQRELGRGGMGVVYLARQVSLNRSVALKLLPGDRHLGPLVRQRFQAEAESAAKVSHPGIVQVYEIGAAGGRPYFALEYCPGGSLAAKLAGTPLPPRQAAELVEGVARAVQAAHDAGVIHRDLKPDNVLFAADRTAKVADFGLAKPVQTDSSLTTDGAVLGTPSYMAPEQARGDSKAVGPLADGYALGAMLYECLTGRPPFRAATLMETLAQVNTADPVAPRKLLPGLPKDLETICLKCLAKEPGKRYPTAAALADDLRRFLDGRPIVARPVSWPERAWKTLRRRPEIGIVAVVVVGALAAVFGVLTASNAKLGREKAAAVDAQRAAEVARADAEKARDEADAQKRKAADRLTAAVDAIESMIAHTGAETWTTNAVLQDERRKLLEDAVNFYEGMARQGDDDPVVLRESAKAYLRAGRAWLNLGDNAKSQAACRNAVALYEGLLAGDHPAAVAHPFGGTSQSPQHAIAAESAAAAEARSFLGHTLAVAGDYPAALTEYHKAVALAEKAVAGNPQDAEAALTLIRAKANIANFYLVADPPRSLKEATAAVELASKLAAAPDALPMHKLAHAETLVQFGNALLATRRYPEAGKLFDQAEAVLAQLGPGSGGKGPRGRRPTGELSEGVTRLKAQVTIQKGAVRLQTARGPADYQAALKQFQVGLVPLDGLLKTHPKAFPYRVMKYQTLAAEAEAYNRLKDTAGRDRVTIELDKLGAEILADSPAATWVLAGSAIRRTHQLIEAVREGKFDRFDANAADSLKLADGVPPALAPVVRYNVACAHAEMAKRGPEADREAHAVAAVGLLVKLADAGYFKGASAAKDLATDTDLDPLRGRDDFKALQARIADTSPKR